MLQPLNDVVFEGGFGLKCVCEGRVHVVSVKRRLVYWGGNVYVSRMIRVKWGQMGCFSDCIMLGMV